MSHSFARRIGTTLALGALVALPACDRESVTEEDHDELSSLEVIDRTQTAQPVVATWTLAGGWNGESELPEISLGDEEPSLTLGFRAFNEESEELELSEGGELEIRYRVADESQAVLDMDRPDSELFHGDHVYLFGDAAGTAEVMFMLWHDGHQERQTAEIAVTVVE